MHVYTDPGTYSVTLVVMNGDCKNTIQHQLTINPLFTLYVPEVFTPNNDGLNDVFLAKGLVDGIGSFEMYIYNRWGEQVFYSADINYGWDGQISNSGNKQSGYYNYVIFVSDNKGVWHTIKGRVLLE